MSDNSAEYPKSLYEGFLWSTYHFEAGYALANCSFEVFSCPLGQQGQGKRKALTLSDTNLREGHVMPGGLAFDVRDVFIDVYGLGDDAAAVLRGLCPRWSFIQTEFDMAPLNFFADQPYEVPPLEENARRYQIELPPGEPRDESPHRFALRYQDVTILVAANTFFGVQLRFSDNAPVAPQDFAIRVGLRGVAKQLEPPPPLPRIVSATEWTSEWVEGDKGYAVVWYTKDPESEATLQHLTADPSFGGDEPCVWRWVHHKNAEPINSPGLPYGVNPRY